jgi:hypothetical protein
MGMQAAPKTARDSGSHASELAERVPTDPKGRFEALARFYGPQKALFDKTWQLSDIERIG